MNYKKMASAWRNFKNIFSRPLFTIIFRSKILFFVTYSILTGQTKVEFVIYWVLKFIYSEKATKFCEISTLILSYVVPVKSKVKISPKFVAFSEYMNFNTFFFLNYILTYMRGKYYLHVFFHILHGFIFILSFHYDIPFSFYCFFQLNLFYSTIFAYLFMYVIFFLIAVM